MTLRKMIVGFLGLFALGVLGWAVWSRAFRGDANVLTVQPLPAQGTATIGEIWGE